MLRHGRAVSRREIAAVAPALWDRLLEVVFVDEHGQSSAERQAAFAYLAGLADPEHTYLRVREPYTADNEAAGGRPVYWFLVALPERNAIAAEVTNEEGHATYLYRIDPGGRPAPSTVARRVRELSRAMQALNFRREVISARAEEIAGERFARYRVALRKLAYLRRVRELYLGRAAHTGQEAWQRRIESLLASG